MSSLSKVREYSIQHPLSAFHITIISLSWVLLTALFLMHLPPEPGIIVLTLFCFIGTTSLITYWQKGRTGVKKLFSETFKFRVHLGFYVLALLALPALTVFVSLILGSFSISQQDWPSVLFKYVVSTFSGFFIINIWEETAWTGFVQSRLMSRNGVLKGSLLSSIGFVGMHIPLYFNHPTIMEFIGSLMVLILVGLVFRYLLGMMYLDSGKSVFIVGLTHASFNNAHLGHKEMLPASIIATVIITLVYGLYRMRKLHAL